MKKIYLFSKKKDGTTFPQDVKTIINEVTEDVNLFFDKIAINVSKYEPIIEDVLTVITDLKESLLCGDFVMESIDDFILTTKTKIDDAIWNFIKTDFEAILVKIVESFGDVFSFATQWTSFSEEEQNAYLSKFASCLFKEIVSALKGESIKESLSDLLVNLVFYSKKVLITN